MRVARDATRRRRKSHELLAPPIARQVALTCILPLARRSLVNLATDSTLPLASNEMRPIDWLAQWLVVSAIASVCLLVWSIALGLVMTMGHAYVLSYWIGFTLLFGLPLVLLYGAPGYLILARKGKARTKPVMILGLAPTALFVLISPIFFAVAVVSAAVVAWTTHHAYRIAQRVRLEPAA